MIDISKNDKTKQDDACNSCEAYHPIDKNGRWIDIKLDGHNFKAFDVDNKYVIEGDMIIEKPELQASSTYTNLSTAKWPNKTLYYRWAADLPEDKKNAFNDAIAIWKDKVPGIKMVYSTTSKDYVEVHNYKFGCYADIGYRGGKQQLNLDAGCYKGQAIHEIGHSLGLYHEHVRSDRDNYIIIKTENIKDGQEKNFTKCTDCPTVGSFDFGSIMLYHSYEFSKNDKPTMTKKDGSTFEAQRTTVSVSDIAGIKKLYGL